MTDQKPPAERHAACQTCGSLFDSEYASQKYGWPDDDTSMPPAAARLNVVKDFRPHDSRALQLRQCPECGTYYLYRTDYTFLVNGTEDEEYLDRLTDEQAAEYLQRPAPPAFAVCAQYHEIDKGGFHGRFRYVSHS